MDFVIAGLAAACAGFFTNPLEVVKVRLQLQGELRPPGHHAVYYKNVFHASYVVAKNDGILALQKGLVPALGVQIVMNGTRLGMYEHFSSRKYIEDSNGKVVFAKRAALSGASGVCGHILATPLHLVKTHTMAQSVKSIAVGYQHKHDGSLDALKRIFEKSGVKGLFRGAAASMPRAFMASTSQLCSFYYVKEYLDKMEEFHQKPLLKSFIASLVGGVVISVVVTPFDLVLTRLYNQGTDKIGRGLTYHGYFDCILKIYKTEGLMAFYKGLGPMYFRLGPHTMLTLVFWDKFKQLHLEFQEMSVLD